jgi:hypothetical protein
MPLDALRDARALASEAKFLVRASAGEAIREWARQYLAADPHGGGHSGDEYDTTTLYYDSPEYHVFHRRGSFGRSKYRVRRYGRGRHVFLERKLRRPGMLSKRRTLVPLDALSRLDEPPTGWEGGWFQRRLQLRRLRPVCEINYHRLARTGAGAHGPIRLTLDEQLVVSSAARSAFGEGDEGLSFLQGWFVLELKYRHAAPPLFKELVEEFALRPVPVSKYRCGVAALGIPETAPLLTLPVHDTGVPPPGA